MKSQKSQRDEMKCPKCGKFELRETGQGITCRICGYTLSPGEADKYRLFRLLKEEEKSSGRR
jgi:ribosomal protein L37AE/L43A